MKFFVTAARGTEELLQQEIEVFAPESTNLGFAGVYVEGEPSLLRELNSRVSIGLRVLLPLVSGPCRDQDDLYDLARDIEWEKYLDVHGTLCVHTVGKGPSSLKHSHFASLKVKDAVVDRFRAKFGERPSVDRDDPDLSIHVFFDNNSVTLSLDSSGASLHKRGYRTRGGGAALRETTAAAIIRSTRWDRQSPFIDFMAGSGTFAIEAARWANETRPGSQRRFAFERWPKTLLSEFGLAKSVWEAAKNRPESENKPTILGFERDPQYIRQAQQNSAQAFVDDIVQFEHRSLHQITEVPDPGAAGVIVVNPPYGQRIGEVKALEPVYRLLGDVLKQHCQGYHAYILTGSKQLAKCIGLRPKRRQLIWNGGIECRLLHFELYSGSRKRKFRDS